MDPQLAPIPWKDGVFQDYSKRSLVIGLMPDDGLVRVHPPVKRAFDELCKKLEAAGHELVSWDTSLNEQCIKIMVSQ